VLLDGRRVVVEEPVEDEGGLTQLAVDDVDPVLRPLIADVADEMMPRRRAKARGR
jgi:hypothetical protein